MADEETVVETDEETTNTAIAEFNDYATPKVKTPRFKMYVNMSTHSTPDWELQGKGIGSYTIEQNAEITKEVDVLGLVSKVRADPQPTMNGVTIALMKGSKLAGLLFNAWYKGDYSALDSLEILFKFEFVDGEASSYVKARLENDVMIGINSFKGEANQYLGFDIDIHFSNDFVLGEMLETPGSGGIVFVPDVEESNSNSNTTT